MALSRPGGKRGDKPVPLSNAPIQTLAVHGANLDLHYIDPAGVLGTAMERKAAQHLSCYRAGKASHSAPPKGSRGGRSQPKFCSAAG